MIYRLFLFLAVAAMLLTGVSVAQAADNTAVCETLGASVFAVAKALQLHPNMSDAELMRVIYDLSTLADGAARPVTNDELEGMKAIIRYGRGHAFEGADNARKSFLADCAANLNQ